MSDEACYWVRHRGKRCFIPGCWGGVLHGPAGCTCRERGPSTADRRIAALEQRVAVLEAKLDHRA